MSVIEQLRNELLALVWRYSQESDITVGQTRCAFKEAMERLDLTDRVATSRGLLMRTLRGFETVARPSPLAASLDFATARITALAQERDDCKRLAKDSAETFYAIVRILEHNCPKQSNAAIQLAKAMVVRLGGDFHEPSDRVVDALIAGSLLAKQAFRSDERCEVCGEAGACKCLDMMPTSSEHGYVPSLYHRVCKRCGLPNDKTAGSCVSCCREFEPPTGDEQ